MILLHNSKTEKVIRAFKRITFFYAVMLLSTTNLFSQTYYFDEYSVQEGLPSKVFDMVQDGHGYVWLASESGISKFDGVNIKNYTSEDGLAEGAIKALLKDLNNDIWMGHISGGISFFNGKEMKIHPISEMIGFEVTSLLMDSKERLWITTMGDGLIRLDNPYNLNPDSIKYEQYKGRISDRIISGTIAMGDSLFFITDTGIRKYVESENSFIGFAPKGLTRYFAITDMYEDKNGDIWFGTFHGGLYRYLNDKKEFIIYDARDGLANNWISTISEDSKGNIWVGTWGGGITKFSNDGYITFNNSNGLFGVKIRKIREDIEGNILIATNEHGLTVFKGEKFITYTVDDGLSNQNVWAITQDKDGKLWFGTNNGISIYNPKAGERGIKYAYFDQESKGIGDQIRFLKVDNNDNIWIGTEDANVSMYNYRSGRFESNPVIGRHFRMTQVVTAMDIDKQNLLWIGTLDGLIYYEIDENRSQILTQGYGLNGNVITVVYVDSKNRVWVGIDNAKGLNMIKDEKIIKVNLEGSYTPNSILEDNDGNIWIGTKAKGIIVLKDTTVQKIITEEDGLVSNVINQLNVDENNNIFIGTSRGLNKIDSGGNIHVYTEKSGFTGIEAKQNATYKDRSGNLWFGTVNGVIKYQPALDKEKFKEPLTHISGLMINYKERDLKPGLKLNFTENTIIFDYNSISFENPDVIRYQIMLEPAEKEWRPITDQTSAIYSSLAPERYTFKVKARNSDGIWNSEPISYSFTIRPPFYKTWWFILTVIVAGILGIIAFIKVRERNLIKEKKILEEKVAERTAEVVQKSMELEKKNKDITDSIRYAKRIQTAVLPPEIPFDNTFVFFRPKDIVSGDFYWLEHIDEREMIAAVDCTGHGVPGAFLSILGHSMLTKIVREYGILEPAKILDRLDEEIIHALHQKNVEGERVVNDGMDLALICYNRKTNVLEFAGGYNPLIMIRNGELEEVKADRFPIGMTTIHTDKKFTNHEIKVEKGDSFYIFSDGYADQFGGEDGRKFRKKNMKDLLLSIQDVPMKDQGTKLEEYINDWMKNHDQIDDMVFIGRRF